MRDALGDLLQFVSEPVSMTGDSEVQSDKPTSGQVIKSVSCLFLDLINLINWVIKPLHTNGLHWHLSSLQSAR